MEKKNNQMVDKEKELKNVAPDTDVAPDVTDASSFQGEPSHPSSNRQQMRLINRIDYDIVEREAAFFEYAGLSASASMRPQI